MEIKSYLSQSSGNNLANSFHPEIGLLWTNGVNVYRTQLFDQKYSYSIKSFEKEHKLLGVFHQVNSVGWSSCTNTPFYAFVVHLRDEQDYLLSIWNIINEDQSFQLSSIGEIKLNSLPLLQERGYTWCPHQNKICIITKDEVIICGLWRNSNKIKSVSLKNGIHKYTSSCWDSSGSFLSLSTENELLIYKCDDNLKIQLQHNLNIDRIYCMKNIDDYRLLGTVELPLDKLVCTEEIADPISYMLKSSESPLNVLTSIQQNFMKPVSASSKLVMINCIAKNPEVIKEVSLPGILKPDLLVWNVGMSVCIVGSTAISNLYVFGVVEDLIMLHQVNLSAHLRPLGILFVAKETLLVITEPYQKTNSELSVPSIKKETITVALTVFSWDVFLKQNIKNEKSTSHNNSGETNIHHVSSPHGYLENLANINLQSLENTELLPFSLNSSDNSKCYTKCSKITML